MQHLIKRSTGRHARNDNRSAESMSLAQRLAANRQASDAAIKRADDTEEVDQVEAAPPPVQAQPAPAPAAEPAPPPAAASAPVADTDAIVRAAKAARDGAKPVSANGKTCLIVDDSRVIRKVARQIMEGFGYAVIEAENGEEALTRCKKDMPHLILTDWNMPVMSGLDFVARMRELPESKKATVVFCTSKGEVADIHAGIAAGADDYIVKPFEETALKAKLESLGAL
ncbi:response regulator [Aurantiacibacter gilvus]|uniref:Response regulator n=1 Tax=Aurantiacibacter gilvus TaxID=3139141 RepID=A0ABU9ID10_9SPHN